MSQREFSAYLAEQGYGVSHTVLNSAAYAVQSLRPAYRSPWAPA